MKRRTVRPFIITLPIAACQAQASQPRILPFPGSGGQEQPPADEPRRDADTELSEVRERLFRMIVAKEWDRSHGNRAS